MDIKKWEDKIKEKRKQTPWRDFIKEICCRYSLVFYKDKGISKFPLSNRIIAKNTEDFYSNNNIIELNLDGLPFFDGFQKLFLNIGLPKLFTVGKSENSNYADLVHNSKNVYLSSSVVFDCENISYCFNTKEKSINCYNSISVFNNSQNIYQSTGIFGSYNIFYSKSIQNSDNCRFSYDLIACSNCIQCNGLRNVKYAINNKVYEKSEFEIIKKNIISKKESFQNFYKEMIYRSKDNKIIIDSQNTENAIIGFNMQNARNIVCCGSQEGNNNYNDVLNTGSQGANNMYATLNSGGGSENIYCSFLVGFSQNIFYSFDIMNCSYCLGCIGLKNKSFCILNKQYTKEERFEKANKIFAQMDKDGTLGQFFPGSMNPFYFNDTVAYLIDDSFTKEEVTAEGYLRRDEEIKVDVPTGAEVILTSELNQYQGWISPPDKGGMGGGNILEKPPLSPLSEGYQRWINPEILKKVIQDEKGNYYRIVPMELEFLQKHGLPLPEIHWLERIKLGFKFK